MPVRFAPGRYRNESRGILACGLLGVNLGGPDSRAVEFRCQFTRCGKYQRFRFVPDGGFVAETLIDGVVVET